MGARFRFVHCSDLHIGSRFKGISDADPALARRMRESVFRSFSRIVDAALEEDARFMVISGDAFDEDTVTPATRHFLVKELARFGRPCFMAKGNHDPVSSWDLSIPFPANVHVFSEEPESVDVPGLEGVEVVGASFKDWHEERNLPSLMRGSPTKFTVACLHCDLESDGSDYAYSPCSLSDMQGKGVDYWALGHIHVRQVVSTDPYVVYSGNIQGRSPKETGEKGAYLVTVEGGSVADLRFMPTQGMVWKDESFDITGKTMDVLIEEMRGCADEDTILRVRLHGSGILDGMLRKNQGSLEEYLSGALGCTVCSVVVGTSPEIDLDRRAKGSDVTAKVIQAGAALRSAGREAILEAIRENPIARKQIDFFEEMTDDELMELADRATRLLVASMEAPR